MADITTPTAQGAKRLSPTKKIAVAGGAATLGVALIGTLLGGGITGASWSDKETPDTATYQSTGQIALEAVSDVSYMDDFNLGAEQNTASNTFSPYPGSQLRRVWTGTVSAAEAGAVTLSFRGATFDIQDASGASVGGGDWDTRFGTSVTVNLDGVDYQDQDSTTPGIQFDLGSNVTAAPLIITIDGTYPTDAGNETIGQAVKILAGDIDLYQSGTAPAEVIVVAAPTITSINQWGATAPAGEDLLLQGTAAPGTTIALMVSNQTAMSQAFQGTVTTDETGTWTHTVSGSDMTAGEYRITYGYDGTLSPEAHAQHPGGWSAIVTVQ